VAAARIRLAQALLRSAGEADGHLRRNVWFPRAEQVLRELVAEAGKASEQCPVVSDERAREVVGK
jgi:hypothetical protein